MVDMRRRAFILGGAAVAWPLAARAQQGERVRRIGVLTNLPPDDPEGMARVAAFLQRLLAINLKTAKALGVPPMLLALADEVIE